MADPWRTCTLCGDAVPAGAADCPTCGNPRAVAEGRAPSLARPERYRLRFIQGLRGLVVAGVVVFLGYLLVGAVLTGPPTFTDPLTTSGTYQIPPGHFAALSGWITGEDYVVGNYTVVDPPGALVALLILNDSEFHAFLQQRAVTAFENYSGQTTSRIVFAAPYTDTFHFVFRNPYPESSHLTLSVRVVTSYQSNVVLG